jgi:hypothetical protein
MPFKVRKATNHIQTSLSVPPDLWSDLDRTIQRLQRENGNAALPKLQRRPYKNDYILEALREKLAREFDPARPKAAKSIP